MTTIIADPQTVGQVPGCPSWCIGRHAASGDRPEGVWHLAASCPSWCSGHRDGEPEFEEEGHSGHCGHATEITLSLAEPYEAVAEGGTDVTLPDSVNVQIWQHPESPDPVVAIEHGATSDWLPEMTPGEAFALGMALIRKAWSIDPDAASAAAASGDGGWQGCPPWCASLPHDSGAPDDVHMSEAHTVPCNLTARKEGHICCYTSCSDPQFNQESCDLPNFAQLVLSADGTYTAMEIGHGDDLLPDMRLDAAERLGLALIGLAAVARDSAPADN